MDFGLDSVTHNKYKGQSCHCWSDHTAAPAYNSFASTFHYRTARSQAAGRQLECCHGLDERHIAGATPRPSPCVPTKRRGTKGASPSPSLPAVCAPFLAAWRLLADPFLTGKEDTVRAPVCTSSLRHVSLAGEIILNAAVVTCLK